MLTNDLVIYKIKEVSHDKLLFCSFLYMLSINTRTYKINSQEVL